MSSQESIYKYTPAKSQSSISSIEDYLNLHYSPDEAAARLDRYNDHKLMLNNVFESHFVQSSAQLKKDLGNWIANSTDGVHTSILLRKEQGIFDFDHPNWFHASTYGRECPNLKSTLRNIVNRFTERGSAVDNDRRLMYDFDILRNWVQNKPDARLIIVLDDADVFDGDVINDLVRYIDSYSDLPLRLVLIANVSPRVFEEHLTRENVERMDTKLFENDSAEFLSKAVEALESQQVIIGLDFQVLLQSENENQVLKVLLYFLMKHYTTNPMALLNKENLLTFLPVIRRLPSFREVVIATPELIKNDKKLLDFTEQTLKTLNISQSGFMRELVINDIDLYFTVFCPNYRPAIEAALAEPTYYYPFTEPIDIRSKVPVAVLYSMIRDSDLYLNIYDHYVMFRDRMDRPSHVSDELWPRVAVAWFQQAITELTKMGIIRVTKRKSNSLEKVAFKGI